MKVLKTLIITMIVGGMLTTYVCAAELTNELKNSTLGTNITGYNNTSGSDLTNPLENTNMGTNTAGNTSNSNLTNILNDTSTVNNKTESNSIITANNTSSGGISDGDLTQILKRDYVQEYLSSIATEKESLVDYVGKIDQEKLFEAMCKRDATLKSQKDKIIKIGIRLYDKDDRKEPLVQIIFDLTTNYKEIIASKNEKIRTGIVICSDTWMNGSGTATISGNELCFALKGDLTGKGEIGVVDLSLMQQQLVEEISLEDEYLNAADMDSNYKIDVVDMSMLQDYITKN